MIVLGTDEKKQKWFRGQMNILSAQIMIKIKHTTTNTTIVTNYTQLIYSLINLAS